MASYLRQLLNPDHALNEGLDVMIILYSLLIDNVEKVIVKKEKLLVSIISEEEIQEIFGESQSLQLLEELEEKQAIYFTTYRGEKVIVVGTYNKNSSSLFLLNEFTPDVFLKNLASKIDRYCDSRARGSTALREDYATFLQTYIDKDELEPKDIYLLYGLCNQLFLESSKQTILTAKERGQLKGLFASYTDREIVAMIIHYFLDKSTLNKDHSVGLMLYNKNKLYSDVKKTASKTIAKTQAREVGF